MANETIWELKNRRICFDKLLFEYRPNEKLWQKELLLWGFDFSHYYHLRRRDKKLKTYLLASNWDKDDFNRIVKEVEVPNQFRLHLIINQYLYLLLKYIHKTEEVKLFIDAELKKDKGENAHIGAQLEELGFGYWPALFWYYSTDTSGYYSKSLHSQLMRYARRLKKLPLKDCLEAINLRYSRLRK
jgi:hypothetical protein